MGGGRLTTVTALDWFIVAFALLLALYGAAQGFIVGAFTLVGFAAGAVLGTRVTPLLLHDGASSPYAPLFALLGATIVGALLASGLGGAGERLRRRLPRPAGGLDATLGAALGGTLALGLAWVAGSVALQTPGARELRRDVQRSAILRGLNDLLPPSGMILHALARYDPFPSVNGPQAQVPAPTAKIARDPNVKRAAGGVVRLLGSACALGIEGSGWIARPGIVVTNAHVVAGEDDTVVQLRGTGPELSAQAIAFDQRNDIAVLRVDGLGGPGLPQGARAA